MKCQRLSVRARHQLVSILPTLLLSSSPSLLRAICSQIWFAGRWPRARHGGPQNGRTYCGGRELHPCRRCHPRCRRRQGRQEEGQGRCEREPSARQVPAAAAARRRQPRVPGAGLHRARLLHDVPRLPARRYEHESARTKTCSLNFFFFSVFSLVTHLCAPPESIVFFSR